MVSIEDLICRNSYKRPITFEHTFGYLGTRQMNEEEEEDLFELELESTLELEFDAELMAEAHGSDRELEALLQVIVDVYVHSSITRSGIGPRRRIARIR